MVVYKFWRFIERNLFWNWKAQPSLIYKINIFNKLFQLMIRLILILYFVGIFILLFNRNHLMLILLRIEFIYIILLFLLLTFFSLLNILRIFVFLIRIVCEAGLGLRLLVIIRFYYGNEFINSLNLIKC